MTVKINTGQITASIKRTVRLSMFLVWVAILEEIYLDPSCVIASFIDNQVIYATVLYAISTLRQVSKARCCM